MALAAALGVVAVGVVAAGLLGRRSGGLAPVGVLLAIALMLSPLVPSWDGGQPVGSRTIVLTSATQAQEELSLGAGELVVDLSDPRLARELSPARPVQVSADVGVGSIVLRVPDTVPVRVRSHVGLGVLPADPNGLREESGADVQSTLDFGRAGVPRVVVDAHVGIGQIQVQSVRAVKVTS
jgi:hypothetical protein